MTPSELFTSVGEALFGPSWKSEMGLKLGVSERQIRRWAAGEYNPPPGVWDELHSLANQRRVYLGSLMRQIFDRQT